MKKALIMVSCLLIQSTAHAANIRMSNPNDISIELGGRALLYSLNYGRTLSENLSLGIGYGGVATNNPDGTPSTATSALIPAYLSLYLAQDMSSPFITLGGNLVTNSGVLIGQNTSVGGLKFAASPIILTFGLGYEYRGYNGLMIRLTAYGLYSSAFFPWAGLSFGYAF